MHVQRKRIQREETSPGSGTPGTNEVSGKEGERSSNRGNLQMRDEIDR